MSVRSQAVGALVERVQGRQVSRMKAVLAAIAAGAVVYRILRSGDGDEEQADEEAATPGEEDGNSPRDASDAD
jgi:hypothetical protein